MRKLLLILPLFTVLQLNAQKKPVSGRAQLTSVCDQIMMAFKSRQLDSVILLLKDYSSIDPVAVDSLRPTIETELNRSYENYGKLLAIDFVREKTIGQIAVKRFYVMKFERFFLKFLFTLYNNGNKWMITGFSF